MTQTNTSPLFAAREWNASGEPSFTGRTGNAATSSRSACRRTFIPYEKLPYESYLNPVVELPREQR